jgi:hypothetical protein
MDKIEQLVQEYNKMKDEFQVKAQAAFKEVFKEFWSAHPNIKAVVWVQYTPYFNDGEPCTFIVHDMYEMTQIGYDNWQEDGGYPEEYTPSQYSYAKKKYLLSEGETISEQEIESCRNALGELSKLPEDIYLSMFGDHVQIVATKEGFEIEEYSHD